MINVDKISYEYEALVRMTRLVYYQRIKTHFTKNTQCAGITKF